MNTEFPDRYRRLGIKIAYYRKLAGLTQAELAERIDKSAAFLGQVEAPGIVCGISLETLFKNRTRGRCITGKAAGGRGIKRPGRRSKRAPPCRLNPPLFFQNLPKPRDIPQHGIILTADVFKEFCQLPVLRNLLKNLLRGKPPKE